MAPSASGPAYAGGLTLGPAQRLRVGRRQLLTGTAVGLGTLLLGACSTEATSSSVPAGFAEFSASVKVSSQADVWLVECSGWPAHEMMIGIKSWQQQVPVPQPFSGTNAFRIPKSPTLAASPISGLHALYNGAIALAVNGVPIFNALNNRGEDTYLAGELDRWGGHCGQADNYHYHLAPLHLQAVVGKASPIAYALDGFPLYGLTEPDGSAVTGLDELNGHLGPSGYHYHCSNEFPYINGGLRGVVAVRDDHVDPQPETPPMRKPGAPLRGAEVTGFRSMGNNAYRLEYTLGGQPGLIEYTVGADEVTFTFFDSTGGRRVETYRRRRP